MIDYESVAIKGNPFDGLSPEECYRLMIYFTVVREPVMTRRDLKSRWGVEIPAEDELPVFKVAEIAEEIRCEIRVRARQALKSKFSCGVLAAAMSVALIAFFTTWYRLRQSRWERDVARSESEALRRDMVTQQKGFFDEIAASNANFSAEMKLLNEAHGNEMQKLVNRYADAEGALRKTHDAEIDAVKQGAADGAARARREEYDLIKSRMRLVFDRLERAEIGNAEALAELKDVFWPRQKGKQSRKDEIVKCKELLGRAKAAIDTNNCDGCFEVGEDIEKFLVLQKKCQQVDSLFDDEMKSDLENSMLKSYFKASERIPAADFRIALLYGAMSFCRDKAYDGYLITVNKDIAKEHLLLAGEQQDVNALLLEFESLIQDSEKTEYWQYCCVANSKIDVDRSKINKYTHHDFWDVSFWDGCVEIGKQIVSNDNATGDDICKVAKWFDTYPVEEQHGQAALFFKKAAIKGNVEAKKWMLEHGLGY